MMDNIKEAGVNFKYLLVSERDKQFGLWVNTVGFQQILKGCRYPLEDHPLGYYFSPAKGRVLREYQLLYITKGEGYFESRTTKKMKIQRGSLIMLFPDQWHTYYPISETGWNEYYIGFEGPLMDNIVQSGFFVKESPLFEVGFHESLINLFVRAIKTAKDDKIAAQQYLAGVVLHLLGKIISISKNELPENIETHEKVERAKMIMYNNSNLNIDGIYIAKELNVSYSWFRKVFKSYTGLAPAQYIQELKINRAKELLAETDMTIKEVAFELNYSSAEYFFSAFKSKTGFTPILYRKYQRGID